ncbi:MAG: polysaccharide deacetylase family protein [Solirubrobacterales bacterium]
MNGLPDRLARRRQELRRKRTRRRRLTLGSGFLLAVAVISIVLLGNGPKDVTDVAGDQAVASSEGSGSNQTAAVPGGAQPDSSWKPDKGPVPILMYHVIGEPAGEVTYPDLYLSVDDFSEQVDWLDRNGYTAVTLIQVQNAWFDGGTLPAKPIVLSFDDGYLGHYVDAMPVLREHGWAGQLNLKAEGSDLSSKQVKKMIRAGWEIASHTTTHPDLPSLGPEALETELVGSKQKLENDLGIEIVNFCYPAGQYDDEVVAAVEAAGYRGATTVDPGLAERNEPFTLKRIRIDRGDGAEKLEASL